MKLLWKVKKSILAFALAVSIFLPLQVVTATSFGEGLYSVLDPAGIDETGATTRNRLESSIGSIINIILGFVGVIILALIIYAGVLWATARGNEQTVQKAKDIMLGGIIGLIIVFTAAGVVNFVISQIGETLTR